MRLQLPKSFVIAVRNASRFPCTNIDGLYFDRDKMCFALLLFGSVYNLGFSQKLCISMNDVLTILLDMPDRATAQKRPTQISENLHVFQHCNQSSSNLAQTSGHLPCSRWHSAEASSIANDDTRTKSSYHNNQSFVRKISFSKHSTGPTCPLKSKSSSPDAHPLLACVPSHDVITIVFDVLQTTTI